MRLCYVLSSAEPMKSLNPRQITIQQEGTRTARTINNAIDIHVEGRGFWFPRLSVHYLSPKESTSFGDTGVRYLSQSMSDHALAPE